MRVLLWIIGICAGLFLLLVAMGASLPSLSERVATARARGLKSVELYASEEGEVRRGVAAVLKDPNSAQYGKFRGYLDDEGRVIVCGTINARNSFGGYTGDAAFYGLLMNDVLALGVIDSATSNLARRTCLDNEVRMNSALIASANALLEKVKNGSRDAAMSPQSGWDAIVVKK